MSPRCSSERQATAQMEAQRAAIRVVKLSPAQALAARLANGPAR